MSNDRKSDIINAFMRLVSRFGIEKTTMLDVAKEVGISVGVIYLDFKNKDELIDAYISRQAKLFMASCEKRLDMNLPAELLLHDFMISFFKAVDEQIANNYAFQHFMESTDFYRYMRKNISKEKCIREEFINIIVKIMKKGVDEAVFVIDDLHQTAMMFLQAFESFLPKMTMTRRPFGEFLPDIERMSSFIIKALKK
jgi:AcrR family transcriptional regulator